MKLAISYFYQIRFFQPNMIPVSTALGDPKWYHDFKTKDYIFLDKRGVVNGLRCEELHGDETCSGLCSGRENCQCGDPSNCAFLKAYRAQLEKIDLESFLKRVENSAARVQEWMGFKEEPVVVFIVHEAPWNPCSERVALLDYFKSHNVDCRELDYPLVKPASIKDEPFDF